MQHAAPWPLAADLAEADFLSVIRVLVFAVGLLGLAACGGDAPKGAAESASRLLGAAMKNDRVAFEAEIDRGAVRDDVRRQVSELARGRTLDVEGGPSEFALDRMIGPEAMKVVGEGGELLTIAPSPRQVGRLMKVLNDGQVCLQSDPGPCQLVFQKERGQWRLVGMRATDLRIEVAAD